MRRRRSEQLGLGFDQRVEAERIWRTLPEDARAHCKKLLADLLATIVSTERRTTTRGGRHE